jgi:hypothetical protein
MFSRFITPVCTLVFLSSPTHATTVNETFVSYFYTGGSVGFQQDGVVGNDEAGALAYSQGGPNLDISEVQLNAYQAPNGTSQVEVDAKLWDGEEPGELEAAVSLTKRVTNTGSVAQDMSFDYTISGGFLSIQEFNNANPVLAKPWETASSPFANGVRLEYTIRVRPEFGIYQEVFRAYYDLWGLAGSYMGESDQLFGIFVPFDASCFCDGGTVTIDPLSGTLDLGSLEPGVTGFIEIAMTATAWGEGTENNLIARLGDPNQVQGTFNIGPSVTQVPLPAGGAMLLGGIAVLFRRRWH